MSAAPYFNAEARDEIARLRAANAKLLAVAKAAKALRDGDAMIRGDLERLANGEIGITDAILGTGRKAVWDAERAIDAALAAIAALYPEASDAKS